MLHFYQFNGVCRNVDGNNPVHLAAINGYTNTMVAILSIHSHLVNAENRAGVSTTCFEIISILTRTDYSVALFLLGRLILRIVTPSLSEHSFTSGSG